MNRVQLLPSKKLNHQQGRSRRTISQPHVLRFGLIPILGLALTACVGRSASAQAQSANAQAASADQLPDAPSPHKPVRAPLQPALPCQVKNAGATMAATGAMRALAVSGLNEVSPSAGATVVVTRVCVPHLPIVNWYARFVTGPEVKPFTPREKARLAVHNLIDPFNLLTIAGDAGIAVAANSHSGYGPGMTGFERYVGVSFTQDMTGEFFNTFLIPSLVHQDPHYHRMPNASVHRRAFHTVAQVFWTQGDDGRGMVNYANIVGFAIDGAISNLYVPGQQTQFSASAKRYTIALATAPIDNVDHRIPARRRPPHPRAVRHHPAHHQPGRPHRRRRASRMAQISRFGLASRLFPHKPHVRNQLPIDPSTPPPLPFATRKSPFSPQFRRSLHLCWVDRPPDYSRNDLLAFGFSSGNQRLRAGQQLHSRRLQSLRGDHNV